MLTPRLECPMRGCPAQDFFALEALPLTVPHPASVFLSVKQYISASSRSALVSGSSTVSSLVGTLPSVAFELRSGLGGLRRDQQAASPCTA